MAASLAWPSVQVDSLCPSGIRLSLDGCTDSCKQRWGAGFRTRYGPVMTGPQLFALAWSIMAVVMGIGWYALATKFADAAERGPKWLWIQHSRRTNIMAARAFGAFFIIVGFLVGVLALTGTLT